MSGIYGFLAAVLGVYSLLLVFRIMISWFAGAAAGKPVDILSRITDPYLNWWRQNLKLQLGFMDFSPVAGIVFLSILQSILYTLARSNGITLGIILSIILTSVWSIVSFVIGFWFLVIVLRMIAYFTNRDVYSGFWRVVDSVSQPLLYRLNRIFFGNRIVGYLKGMIVSSLALAVVRVGGGYAVPYLAGLLVNLPI